MWVQVKATSDTVEISLDKNKPVSFNSKEAEIEWDKQTARNALKFKELVETGQFIPDEIRQKLEAKTNRSPQEEEILKNEKLLSNRKEKVFLTHSKRSCNNSFSDHATSRDALKWTYCNDSAI
jgi:hypothetical protein